MVFCPNCGKEIPEGSNYCIYCGEEIIKENNIQDDSTNKTHDFNSPVLDNKNLSTRPEINVRVTQEPNPSIDPGMEYAVHSAKSYIGYAWLTIFLYLFTFWIGGLISNIVF